MALIKGSGAPDISAGGGGRPRVMNAEEVEARGMSKAILDKAQADAAQIIAKARQEEQAILEEARRKGKEEGLAHVTEELARAKMQAGEMLKAASKEVIALALIV